MLRIGIGQLSKFNECKASKFQTSTNFGFDILMTNQLNNMSKYIFILILFCCTWNVEAQKVITQKEVSGKAKNLYERSRQYGEDGKLEKAISDITKVISIEPGFVDAHILYGSLLYDQKNYAEAEKGFEKALELRADYKPITFYLLALTEANQKKFAEAAAHLEDYLNSDHKSTVQRERAKAKLAEYQFKEKAFANPVPFEPKALGDNINSPHSEYSPALTADGQTLIYTRLMPEQKIREGKQEDFYMSTQKEGKWELGYPILDLNKPYLNEGAQSISANGKMMVFTACDRQDGVGSCDIYYTEVQNGKWTKPQNIGYPINSRKWESLPSLSADGNTLYFSSNRDGTVGSYDLWVSQRVAGKWQKPQNLGKKINTNKEEKSPFIHPDGQTLYFMSNGHPGMGNYDLYYARKDKNGEWGEPVNLGYPINTPNNEGALIVSLDGKTAYFASDQKYDNTGNASVFDDMKSKKDTDLYSFELYPEARPQLVTYVKAQVSDAQTGQKLIANVEFVALALQKMYASSKTDSDGEFLVCLPMGKNYGLNVSKEGYLFHSENFALEGENTLDKPYILDIKLQKIPENIVEDKPSTSPAPSSSKPIILRNIFFETGSAELRPESVTELTQLKNLLKEYPNMNIQINGHTDNVGSDSANLTLSENRAKSVRDWLIKNSISANRLSAKGFGESQAIDTNDTAEGRQNNRRTEFQVL